MLDHFMLVDAIEISQLILRVRKTLFFIFILTLSTVARSQQNDFYLEGLELEKEFHVEEALGKYESAIAQNPNHAKALTHASRMISNIGGRLPNTEHSQKRALFERAKTYAQKSIEIAPKNAEAHLAYTISLGLLSEIATNPNDKVRYAQQIHHEATQILKIDSTFAEAYFILGKWQLELSQLNWMELMACKLFFGGFPEEISLPKAEYYFKHANSYKPDYILFLFGLASAQHALGEDIKAIQTLQKALSLPPAEPDDVTRKERCRLLLNEIRQ
jgi:tetratricopeptide (TPR) repeat protein